MAGLDGTRPPQPTSEEARARAVDSIANSLPRLLLPVLGILMYQYVGPSRDNALRMAASEHIERGDARGAERLLRQAVEVDPTKAVNFAQLGVSLVAQSRRREAAHQFEQALLLQPDNVQAQKLLAVQQRVLAQKVPRGNAEAVSLLGKAAGLRPADGDAYSALGSAWAARGAKAEALGALKQAVTLSPASSEAHHNLGVLQLTTGMVEAARASFTQAAHLAGKPRSLASEVMRAVTLPRNNLEAVSRVRSALEAFESASPGQSDAAAALFVPVARTLLSGATQQLGGEGVTAVGGATGDVSQSLLPSGGGAGILEALRGRGYVVLDSALGTSTLSAMQRAAAELAPLMSTGRVGVPTARDSGEKPESRSDRVVRLSSSSQEWRQGLSTELDSAIQQLRGLLATELYAVLLEAIDPSHPPLWPREELQFACYDKNAFYGPHVDEEAKGAPAASVARAFTAIYYPNEASEDVWGSDAGNGGALRLWPAGSCEFLEASNPQLVIMSDPLPLVFGHSSETRRFLLWQTRPSRLLLWGTGSSSLHPRLGTRFLP